MARSITITNRMADGYNARGALSQLRAIGYRASFGLRLREEHERQVSSIFTEAAQLARMGR